MSLGDDEIILNLPISAVPCEQLFTLTQTVLLVTEDGEENLPAFIEFD